jgi:hypothetical protein
MGQGYCVIGLEKLSADSFRSVRPMPPWGFAWREPFKFNRGDIAHFDPRPTTPALPHTEDLRSYGLSQLPGGVREEELVGSLRKAEVSPDLEHLFECVVESSSAGGRALWVNPADACRSICGCDYSNISFRLFPEPKGFTLRAELVLASNERLRSIPIVDREWRRFANQLAQRIQRSNPFPLAERFLNWKVRNKLCALPQRFARIGLPRPREDKRCWLMLDSLFPQPQDPWLDEL